jgi:hypothetical protein
VKCLGEEAEGSPSDVLKEFYVFSVCSSNFTSPEEIIFYLYQLYEIPKKNAKKLGGVELVRVWCSY